MQNFARVNSLSLQMNASSQKQRESIEINPKDKLQIESMALPIALLWRHVISCQDMPSGWQQPHIQTHTQIHKVPPWSGMKQR